MKMNLLLLFCLGASLCCIAQVKVEYSEVEHLKIDDTGWLTGEITKVEHSEYYLQQFRWNKWINIDTLRPNKEGIVAIDTYIPLHSGKNKIRIDYKVHEGMKCRSVALFELDYGKKKVKHTFDNNKISFSSETMYEIYDQYGNFVMRGRGTDADLSTRPRGLYYLNYDNKMTEVLKK